MLFSLSQRPWCFQTQRSPGDSLRLLLTIQERGEMGEAEAYRGSEAAIRNKSRFTGKPPEVWKMTFKYFINKGIAMKAKRKSHGIIFYIYVYIYGKAQKLRQ